MKVWNDIPQLDNTTITIGTFDGVHCGHRALLRRLVEVAQQGGMESVVVTFDPHPRELLGSDGKFFPLTSPDEKNERIAELGVDNIVVVPFTLELAQMPAEEFVEHILVAKLGMKHFVVGYDNHFGRNRQGSAESVSELGRRLGFSVEQVERVGDVSSTKIREAIRAGEHDRANEMLGNR